MSIILSKKNKKYSLGKGVSSTSNQPIKYFNKGTYIDFNNNKVYVNPRYRLINGDIAVYVRSSYITRWATISTFSTSLDFSDSSVSGTSFASSKSLTSNGTKNRAVYVDTSYRVFNISNKSNVQATLAGQLPISVTLTSSTSNGSDSGVIVYDIGSSSKSMYINADSLTTAILFGDSSDGNTRFGGYGLSNGRNQRGIFGGGRYNGNEYSTLIEYITIDTRSDATIFGNLSEGRRYAGAVSNDIYDTGLYIGGSFGVSASDYRDSIEKITISTTSNATIVSNITNGGSDVKTTSNGIGDIAIMYGRTTTNSYYDKKFNISSIASSITGSSLNSSLTSYSLTFTSNGAL